jgi:hypothetical protein
MNLPDSEFEEQLRLLHPRPTSPQLEEAIAASLQQREIALVDRAPTAAILRPPRSAPASFWRWFQGIGWALAGAAAAVAAIVLVNHFEAGAEATKLAATTAAAAPAAGFEYAESNAELVTTEDEGLVLAGDQEPVRQVRYHSLERHVWVNPNTGARMEVEVPREDVRFMPVAMQ